MPLKHRVHLLKYPDIKLVILLSLTCKFEINKEKRIKLKKCHVMCDNEKIRVSEEAELTENSESNNEPDKAMINVSNFHKALPSQSIPHIHYIQSIP